MSSMLRNWRPLTLLPLSAALMAQAPPPDARTDSEVVVMGERLSRAERHDRATAYIAGNGAAVGERAIARWVDPVCVKAIGLKPEQAGPVEDRVREIARAAGVPLAKGACQSNAIIAFVADGPAAMREVANKRGSSLGDVIPSEHKTLMESDAPVRWWYQTRAQGSDGRKAAGTSGPGMTMMGSSTGTSTAGSSSGAGLPGNMDTTYQTVSGSSFISTHSQRVIDRAQVVVDVKKLNGVGLDAVADYAAFVLLAEVRPPSSEQRDSILGLFYRPGIDRRLTDWDALFLSEFYRMPPDRNARRQRQTLISAIADPKRP